MKFLSFAVHARLLQKVCCCMALWPATPVEPTLAFTMELMHWALALMMECQVSLYDFCRALEFFKNPLLKVQYCMLCFPAVIICSDCYNWN